jgi:hypothetical protein
MAYKVTQNNPASATPADLYTVPSAKEAVISTLTICNYGTGQSAYSVWIRPAGASAANVHLLASNVVTSANETSFITAGIALATSDVVTVQASTNTVTFQAFISEVDA